MGGPKSRVQAAIAARPAKGGARGPVVLKATLNRPVARTQPASAPARPGAKPLTPKLTPKAAAVKPALVAKSIVAKSAPTLAPKVARKPAALKPALGARAKVAARPASAVKVASKPVIRPPVKPVVKAPAKALVKLVKSAAKPARQLARPATGGKRAKVAARPVAPASRLVRIKALDPCARCGPNTSVEQLYRVDEQVAGTATVHLVFFDRHGWYCVHGATCVAVRDVHAELKAQRAGRGR